jgi:S-DNA-T family DNA segregation ATPase FtsK/SpoIIIE
MIREWKTPGGDYSLLFADCLKQHHLLIAGECGSGKSVFENGLMYTALLNAPCNVGFILLDPKLTELIAYKDLEHTITYANDGKGMINALKQAVAIIMARNAEMSRKRIKTYEGSDIYVVVDELQDLMTTHRKEAFPLLQRIAQIGRAAKVHLIACTQSPISKIIPTELKCNFTSRIGLRTISRQDSRNILDMAGCETLPDPAIEHKAFCYYRRNGNIDKYIVPYTQEADINKLINHWRIYGKGKLKLFRR